MGIVNQHFKNSHKTVIIPLSDFQITENIFKIPPYQRNYSWGEEQIEDLMYSIDSLLQNKESRELIYLGTIIVLQESNQNNEFEILDGQQRLTTLFLYIRALLDAYDSIINNADYQTWKSHELKKEFEGKFDRKSLEKIISNQGDPLGLGIAAKKSKRILYKNEKENRKYDFSSTDSLDRKNRFQVNYNTLYNDIISNYEKEKKINLTKSLTYIMHLANILSERIIFDFTITNKAEDAFSIFESLNTTGLLLSPSDIVSGTINSGKFSSIANNYNDITDDLVNDKFDITNLLHYFVQIKKHDTSVGKSEIVAYFRNINEDKIEELLMYFLIIQEFKLKNNVLFYLINSSFNRKQLWPLIYGLLLYNHENNISNQNKEVLYLINFIMMFSVLELNILKHSPGGIFKRILNKYSAEVSKNGLENIPSDFVMDDLRDYLKTIQYDKESIEENIRSFDEKYKKGMLIYYIYMNNESIQLDLTKLNLEHIYPQNPDNEWFVNGWDYEQEVRTNLINSFGNLILLNEKINKKISNLYINTKTNIYSTHLDEALKNAKINCVDFSKFDFQKGDYIEDRTKTMVEMILHIQPLKKLLELLKK